MTGFPEVRLRRLRRHPAARALVRETRLSPDRFVAPLFVRQGSGVREAISSLEHAGSSVNDITDPPVKDGVRLFSEAADTLLAAVDMGRGTGRRPMRGGQR